jgi:hypothetical protein
VLVGHDDSLDIEERSYATDGGIRERVRWRADPNMWPPAPLRV